ncbi:MAG: helix-turn-helix transcriptional regulator [Acidobacteriaceae bacterium]
MPTDLVLKMASQLGECLKAYREHCWKISQAEAADRLQISRATYQRMESGDDAVSVRHWLDAWRRMNVDARHAWTVADALQEAADPGPQIARQIRDEVLGERLVGDPIHDAEEEARTVMGEIAATQKPVTSPRKPFKPRG